MKFFHSEFGSICLAHPLLSFVESFSNVEGVVSCSDERSFPRSNELCACEWGVGINPLFFSLF